MPKHIERTGFTPPPGHTLGHERRTVAVAELVASIGLAVSIVVAVTAVSMGVARASGVGDVIDNEGSIFAIALILGALFVAMGGLTVLTLPGQRPRRRKI